MTTEGSTTSRIAYSGYVTNWYYVVAITFGALATVVLDQLFDASVDAVRWSSPRSCF